MVEGSVELDEQARVEILRAVRGIRYGALRQLLLNAARSDQSGAVRERVAINLREFLPDTEVQAELSRMQEKDPDARVREEAKDALDDSK